MALHDSHTHYIRSFWKEKLHGESSLRELMRYARYAPGFSDRQELEKNFQWEPSKYRHFSRQNLTYYAFACREYEVQGSGGGVLLQPNPAYLDFAIPRKSGGVRVIHAPSKGLKRIQKSLNVILQAVFSPHHASHGFIPGKSIVTNAQSHVGKPWVLNMDIKDFFPSIEFRRIKTVLELPPFNLKGDVEELGFLIANLCCKNGRLPQGAPTSPVLSNIVCQRLDRKLHRLARQHRASYTRYADDLTFSRYPGEFSEAFMNQVREIVREERFEVNEQKVRQQHWSMRQEVTGLVVNQKVNVNREYVRATRTMLHNWEKSGYAEAAVIFDGYVRGSRFTEFSEHLQGRIQYIGMVKGTDDPVYRKFRDRLAALEEAMLPEDPVAPIARLLNLWKENGIEAIWKELVPESEGKEIGNTGRGLVYFSMNEMISQLDSYRYSLQKNNLWSQFFGLLEEEKEQIVKEFLQLESSYNKETLQISLDQPQFNIKRFLRRRFGIIHIRKAEVKPEVDPLSEMVHLIEYGNREQKVSVFGNLVEGMFTPSKIFVWKTEELPRKKTDPLDVIVGVDITQGWVWWDEAGGSIKFSNEFAESYRKNEGRDFVNRMYQGPFKVEAEEVFVVDPVVFWEEAGALKEWEEEEGITPEINPENYTRPLVIETASLEDHKKKGRSRDTATFLTKAFGQSTYMKYFTHDNDPRFTYQELMDGAKKEWEELWDLLPAKSSVRGLVYSFCFKSRKEDEKSDLWTGWDREKLKKVPCAKGWSSPDVKAWVEKKGRSWKSLKEKIPDGFGGIVSLFKSTIEFREDRLKKTILKAALDALETDRRIRLADEWVDLEFYTQTERVFFGIKKIFSASKNHQKSEKLLVFTRKIQGSKYCELVILDEFPKQEKITHSANQCTIGFRKGDLLDARISLAGLCEWEIHARFSDGAYCFPILSDDPKLVGVPRPINDDQVTGFTHVLRFYL